MRKEELLMKAAGHEGERLDKYVVGSDADAIMGVIYVKNGEAIPEVSGRRENLLMKILNGIEGDREYMHVKIQRKCLKKAMELYDGDVLEIYAYDDKAFLISGACCDGRLKTMIAPLIDTGGEE